MGWGYSCPLRNRGGSGGVIKFVGVSQPKPLHRFLPNFQDVFTPRGSSKADYVLGGIWK